VTLPANGGLAPASREAIAMAAAWAGQSFTDEAEALLALELAFRRAIESGAEPWRGYCQRAMDWGLNGARGYSATEACKLGDEIKDALNTEVTQ
jgi:hypothetical protein